MLTETQIRSAPTVNCTRCAEVIFEDDAEYLEADVDAEHPYCGDCVALAEDVPV